MKEYTYQDMLKMQEQAAERVREMQQMATEAVDDSPSFRRESVKNPRVPDRVKRISYPVEIGSTLPEQQEEKHSSGLLDMLSKDSDVFLILSLIMAIRDTDDYALELALLYILL